MRNVSSFSSQLKLKLNNLSCTALTAGEVPNKEYSSSLFPPYEKWTTLLRFLTTILTLRKQKEKLYKGSRFLIQKPQPNIKTLTEHLLVQNTYFMLTARFSKFTIAKFSKSAFHSYLYTPVDESSILHLHKSDFVFHRGCNRYYKHIGLYLRACNYDRLFFRYLHGLAIDRRLVGIRQGIAKQSGNKTKKGKMCYVFFFLNQLFHFLFLMNELKLTLGIFMIWRYSRTNCIDHCNRIE